MPKAKPILHTQFEGADGCVIASFDEFALSESQLDWLAAFFAPIVEKAIQEKGTRS
jgi:hypothetical protein